MVSSQFQDHRAQSNRKSVSKPPKMLPETPKTCPRHQIIPSDALPGWMKFALLALAVAGFIMAMVLFH
jgi:hypothetical protein